MDFTNYRYHLVFKQMRRIFTLCDELSKIWRIDRKEIRDALKIIFCERGVSDTFLIVHMSLML